MLNIYHNLKDTDVALVKIIVLLVVKIIQEKNIVALRIL